MEEIKKPTVHQNQIAEEVIYSIENRIPYTGLFGSAGVGKTFLLNYIVDQLWEKGYKEMHITAPTHKAVEVVARKVDWRDDFFQTIHSYLGYTQVRDEDRVWYQPRKNYKQPRTDLLIVDECSMLDMAMIRHIGENIDSPVLFVGDNKQLNPIGEDISFSFDIAEGYFLAEIVRQAQDNEIINLSANLDLIYKRKNTKDYMFTDTSPLNLLVESNGGDFCKYISWTNEVVNKMNTIVRKKIYGPKVERFEVGETICMREQYLGYRNNQEVEVTSVEKNDEFWILNKDIKVPTKSYYPFLKMALGNLAKAAKISGIGKDWKTYWDLKDSFTWVSYNHAITTHRSQGSTYKNTIINLKDILRNPNKEEMKRMLYTAITRTSNKIYFIV